MARATVVLLIAALAGGCGAPGSTAGTPEPTATPSPVAPSPSPESPDPTDPAPGVTLQFERVLLRDDVQLSAVAALGDGFVVAGCVLFPPDPPTEGPCERGLILTSPDGTSWHEVPVPDAAQRRIFGLAVTPLGLLAFGRTQESEPPMQRAMWRSSDGETWEPFPVDAPSSIVFEMAASLGGGTVLIGTDTAYDFTVQTEAWATVDGRSWTTGATPQSRKVEAHPGLVAAGLECVDLCPADEPTQVFRSADGLAWSEEDVPAALASTEVTALTSREGRAVLGGMTAAGGSSEAVLWLDEPTGWRQAILPDSMGQRLDMVLVAADGLVVIAHDESDGAAAISWTRDGVAWLPAILEGIDVGAITDVGGEGPLVVILDETSIWISD